jgi:hypothetical protein
MDTIRRAAQRRFDIVPCFHDKSLTFRTGWPVFFWIREVSCVKCVAILC